MASVLYCAWILTTTLLVRTIEGVETDCFDHRMPQDLGITAYVNVRNDAPVWYFKMWTPLIGDDSALRRTCVETAPSGVLFLGMVKSFAQTSGIMKDNMVTCYGVRNYEDIITGRAPGWLTLRAVERSTGYINHDTDFIPMRVYVAEYEGAWHLMSSLIFLSMPFFDNVTVTPFCKVWPDIMDKNRMDAGAPVTDCNLDWKQFVLASSPTREQLLEKSPFYRKKCEGRTPWIKVCSAPFDAYREAFNIHTSVAILPNVECRAREMTRVFRRIFTDRYKCERPNILRPRVTLSLTQEILRTVKTMLKASLFAIRATFFALLQEWQGLDPLIALKGFLAVLIYHRIGNIIVTMLVVTAVEGVLRLTGLTI